MSNDFYTNSILPYAGIIIKICRAYSNSQVDFEDHYQEVCLQIWRSRENFKRKSEWSTWIYRISLNVCLTLKRNEQKRKQRLVSSNNFPEIENKETPEKHDEPLLNLYRAIRVLSEIDKAIIILYLEEKSYKEIAKIIGTNANNIGVRIKRIKEKLKKIISNHENVN